MGSYSGWKIVAVGHRVVHGGERYAQPIVIDNTVLGHLESFVPLAPLHQPHNVAGIEALRTLLPEVPQVACFDTAFHRSQPDIAQQFALPRSFTAEGIKRYGFHGLSYEYIARTLPQHSHRADGRVVVCHLGNGASMAAMVRRKCVATTLGFSTIVAAKTKGIQSAVAGQAEILVVPDLESGNMVAKQLEYLANALTAGIVLGTKVPIVLTSRADTAETRTASCVIAALIAHAKRAKENA